MISWCIGIQYTQKNNSFVILNVYTTYNLSAMDERPKQGPEFEQKKLVNSRYKYAIRFIFKTRKL